MSSIKRIEWAIENFGNKVLFTTSGGKTSCVLLHLISKLENDYNPLIIFVDTGYYPPETIEIIQKKMVSTI